MADQNTNTPIVPAFDFTNIQMGGYSPLGSITVAGSNLGVPPNDSVANETPSGGGASSATAYGNASAQAGVLYQPVFWAIVLLVVSVFMFAHMAHLEVRT